MEGVIDFGSYCYDFTTVYIGIGAMQDIVGAMFHVCIWTVRSFLHWGTLVLKKKRVLQESDALNTTWNT
jgi:hypothetical protein